MAPQFGYWNIQGLGQSCRMLLHYTDTKYDNIVYHIGSSEWGAAKENNAWDLSFPNLPYYVDGNVKLTQSNAILRHLGRQHGLYGLNEKHAAEIDMLLDTSIDIKQGLSRPAAFTKTLDTKRAEVIQGQDVKFKQLSHFLGSKKFLMGNAVTIADFAMYDALKWHDELDSKLIGKYANLMEYIARFEKLPKVKSFLSGPNYMANFFPPFAIFGGNRTKKMTSTPSLRLVYFQVRARVESARMILAYGNIAYKDDDCNSYFGMSFPEAKKAGKMPFGQLPILEVGGADGKLIAQSGSINRYLASLVETPGFYPTDPVVLAYCDMIHETAQDMFLIQPIVNVYRDDTWKQKKTEFFENILPSKLTALYKHLGDKKFFCGDIVTYCDFHVYHHFDLCRLVVPTVFNEYPKIVNWMKNVEALPGVKQYLEKRPVPVDIGTKPMLKPRN